MFATILSLVGSFLTGGGGAALGEIGLSLVAYYLQKGQNNAAARGRFLDMIQQNEADGSFPAGFHAKFQAQLSRVDDAIDAELAKEKAAAAQAAKATQAQPPQPPAAGK